MTEQEIYDGVIVGGTADISCVVEILSRCGAGWCIIGGFAVNNYAKPVDAANLTLVMLASNLEPVLDDFRATDFRVKQLPFATVVQRQTGLPLPGTYRLTIRLVYAECYEPFIERATTRSIFGFDVPVAALSDVIQGKLWALSRPSCRVSARVKDRFDLMRLAEQHFDEVIPLLPPELRAEAEANRLRRLEIGDNGWGDDDHGEP